MTDRELLEAAAKAAGIDLQHKPMFGGDSEPGFYDYRSGKPEWLWWNPLIDDGDALRLAVKLKMMVDADMFEERVLVVAPMGNGKCENFVEQGQSMDVVRKCIVRAAAEIGRAAIKETT